MDRQTPDRGRIGARGGAVKGGLLRMRSRGLAEKLNLQFTTAPVGISRIKVALAIC